MKTVNKLQFDKSWKKYLYFFGLGFLILSFTTVYIFLGLNYINQHRLFHEAESAGYLEGISQAKKFGGPLGVLYHLYSGQFLEANRQPLYIMLLSIFFNFNPDFFVTAKIITFFIGLIFIIILAIITWRYFSFWSLLLVLGLLVVNQAWLYQTTFLACESLLMVFFFLAWLFLGRGFKQQKFFLWGGIFLALAYLTKGTAVLLILSFLGALILFYHYRIFKRLLTKKYIWLTALLIIIVLSPYLVRNYRAYGSPLYNYNTAYMWVDNFADRYRPGDYSFSTFQERHGWQGIWQIFLTATKKEIQTIEDIFRWDYPPVKETSKKPIYLFYLLLVFALLGLITDKNRGRMILSILTFIAFFLFFSWWARFDDKSRFLLPVVPIFLIYSALGIIFLAKKIITDSILTSLKKINWLLPVLFCLPVIIFTIIIFSSKQLNFQVKKSYSVPEGYLELIAWGNQNWQDNDFIIYGHDVAYQFVWLIKPKVKVQRIPLYENPQDFLNYLQQQQPQSIIVHSRVFNTVEKQLAGYLIFKDNKFISYQDLPDYQIAEFPGTELEKYLIYHRLD